MKKWMILLLTLVMGMPVQAKEEPNDLYARSAVLMDAESGRVLFEKNGTEVRAMASTTKIMTCILALEQGSEDMVVTFSSSASKQPKVHLGASKGEQFYLGDLLYSLMLESHNDSAVAIAEAISGDVTSFADRMNQKAKEMGCEHTYFITPNGLDASDEKGTHSTTATDLARMMSYCIMDSPKKERFLEITQTAQYSFSNLEGKQTYTCTNHNAFLGMMEEAISGKTGFTADAGYCYVGAVESEGRTFVVALLACGWPNNKSYKWSDMKKLVAYGMEHYEYQKIEIPEQNGQIQVLNGISKSGDLFEDAFAVTKVQQSEALSLLLHKEETVETKVEQKEAIPAPVPAGTEVGWVTYYLEGEVVAAYPIVTTEPVKEKNIVWCFQKMAERYFVF